MPKSIAVILLALGAAVARAGTPVASGRARADENAPAAESLRHSATSLVHDPPAAPGRAGRLVALARYAERIAPGQPRTNRLLADIRETQGDLASAASAVEACLAQSPHDHALAMRWLRLRLASLHRAGQRAEFLAGAAARKQLAAPARAQAVALRGEVLVGMGERPAARRAFDEALRLDRGNRLGLTWRLQLRDSPAVLDRVGTALGLLRGNPAETDAGWELATLLDSLGLAAQALEFFQHVRALSTWRQPDWKPPQAFLLRCANAMLNAGRHAEAARTLAQAVQRFGDSADLRSLWIEALRATGQTKKLARQIGAMRSMYEARKDKALSPAARATELAWFALITRGRYDTARAWARQAVAAGGDNPLVQRVLGAAELKLGQTAAGLKRLTPMKNKDAYAAVFLAEHYYSVGDKAAGQEAVLAGVALGRSGPAFRRLSALARKHGVTIPRAAGAEAVGKAVAALDRRILQMGRSPEKAVAVAIRPVGAAPQPGEPVAVTVTLTNTASVPVPLGEWGLLSPVVALQVSVVLDGKARRFTNLPLAVLPAGRYLPPGQTVSREVRLDVGRLGATLAARPFETLALTVTGLVDPIQAGRQFTSSVPPLRPEPAKVLRKGILVPFDRSRPDEWPRAYRLTLGWIVRDIQRGTLAERLRAARQVGSLLAAVRQAELRRTPLPAPLGPNPEKPALLRMLQEVLKDARPVVRAEMLTALGDVDLDESILRLLAPAITDASPLVRFRAAELIGSSGAPGGATILRVLARDEDERVRRMASAFRTAR